MADGFSVIPTEVRPKWWPRCLSNITRPERADALKGLMRLFQTAEDSYFGQWSSDRFQKGWGVPLPGEFKLDQRLFETIPGPATYLKEPCLDAAGRMDNRKA